MPRYYFHLTDGEFLPNRAILTGLAKDAPELENQLLYVAEKWLTLVIIGEQLSSGADRALHKLCAPNQVDSMERSTIISDPDRIFGKGSEIWEIAKGRHENG